MSDRKIMYVCEHCADENPEGCGHYDVADIFVMPDGTWLCEQCAEEFDNMKMHGVKPRGTAEDGSDAEWPMHHEFPHPPVYTST